MKPIYQQLYCATFLLLAFLACIGGVIRVLSASSKLKPPIRNYKKFILAFAVSLSVALIASSVWSVGNYSIITVLSLFIASFLSLPPLELPKERTPLNRAKLIKGLCLYGVGLSLIAWSGGPYGLVFLAPIVLFGMVFMLLYIAVAGGEKSDYLLALMLIPLSSGFCSLLVWGVGYCLFIAIGR